jgi:inhibitor of cysteine peptidase
VKAKLLLVMSVLVLSSLALSGCGPPGEIVLADGDDRTQITLQPGQPLAIRLEGNPTTGYTWEVKEVDTSMLRQIGEAEFESESDLPGSGGIQTLRFEAVATGETTLLLVYHRPFETEDPLETFSLNVTVP